MSNVDLLDLPSAGRGLNEPASAAPDCLVPAARKRKLHAGHFAFMRAVVQGLVIRARWERYLRVLALVHELSTLGLQYVHVLEHSAMGALSVPADLKFWLRAAFQGLFILAGGFDRASAESALKAGQAELIAFARPFLAIGVWSSACAQMCR